MTRYVIAIFVSVCITLGLFFLMQSLIQSGGSVLTEPPQGSVLDFVRVKKEESVEKKDRKPQKPPKPETPPPDFETPQMDMSDQNEVVSGLDFGADIASELSLSGGLSLDTGDGEYLPIVKVAPVYPRRALQRGIEGFVIVEFTVSPTGAVVDPFVIEAEPANIFEQSALDAAKKFKYKPRVINGEATAVSGVQNRISFKING